MTSPGRAHDCLINVHFGDMEQPEWMHRVKNETFKRSDSIFGKWEMESVLAEMDANGVERGEFINVGAIVHCRERGFLGARVELDEARLGTMGEAFVFGCVLDELYAAHVALNSLTEQHLQLHPSKVEFGWPARSGRQHIV